MIHNIVDTSILVHTIAYVHAARPRRDCHNRREAAAASCASHPILRCADTRDSGGIATLAKPATFTESRSVEANDESHQFGGSRLQPSVTDGRDGFLLVHRLQRLAAAWWRLTCILRRATQHVRESMVGHWGGRRAVAPGHVPVQNAEGLVPPQPHGVLRSRKAAAISATGKSGSRQAVRRQRAYCYYLSHRALGPLWQMPLWSRRVPAELPHDDLILYLHRNHYAQPRPLCERDNSTRCLNKFGVSDRLCMPLRDSEVMHMRA